MSEVQLPSPPMRVICVEFTDAHWLEVIERLARDHGVEPSYWTGTVWRRADIASRFPSAIFHASEDAIRGIPAPAFAKRPLAPLDGELLARMAEYELTCLKMMERLDFDRRSFTYEERTHHYYHLLRYWMTVLEALRPDAVLMPITPHLVFDYVLYALCSLRRIPVVMAERTAIPGRVIMLDRIEGGNAALRRAYEARLRSRDSQQHDVSPDVEAYLQRLCGSYDEGMAPNFKLKLERLNIGAAGGATRILKEGVKVARYEGRAIARAVLRDRLRPPRNYIKEPKRSPALSHVGLAGYYLKRWQGMWTKARLRRLYRSLECRPALDRPYVFVALHYQPERNTVPVGGFFADQQLIVDLLAKTVPTGWHIYVKEHVWQLHPYSRGQQSRDPDFYKGIAALPNVSFVPVDTPAFPLIDGAKAVATVAGSVAWEAVNRGRPALVFGEAWYQDCEGVYRIRSAEDCRTALGNIQAGIQVSRHKLRAFVAALDEVAVRSVIEPRLEVMGGITAEENVANLARAYAKMLRPGDGTRSGSNATAVTKCPVSAEVRV